MAQSIVTYSDLTDSSESGRVIGEKVNEAFAGRAPDALILFASSSHDYQTLLAAVHKACRPALLVGCSSAGEFTENRQGEGSVSALALRASDSDMFFSASVGRGIQSNHKTAVKELVSSFKGMNRREYPYRTALILTDALAGNAENIVEELTLLTAGRYQLVGGGAGDDAHFQRTHLFFGQEALTDAVVTLEILSKKPIGIGVGHGWQPATAPMRVTEAEGFRLISLNAIPTVEIFQEHAEKTGQPFDTAQPVPFFLHNILGIDTGQGYKLRVPLSINSDGSVNCAAEIPTGSTVFIMRTSAESAAQAASKATAAALEELKGHPAEVALFFDCVATRLRLGKEFGLELKSLRAALGGTPFAGFNTYGQIARAEGQFSGFHNCTAVVCAIGK